MPLAPKSPARPARLWARARRPGPASMAAVIASAASLGVSVWTQQSTTSAEATAQRTAMQQRFNDVLGEVSDAVAAGSVAKIPLQVAELGELGQRLGDVVTPLQNVQIAEAMFLNDDLIGARALVAQTIDELGASAQGKSSTSGGDSKVFERVLLHRSLGRIELVSGNAEAGRDQFRTALRLATPETLGSDFAAADVNFLTEVQWANAEAIAGNCAESAEHSEAAIAEAAKLSRTVQLTIASGLASPADLSNPTFVQQLEQDPIGFLTNAVRIPGC